MNRYKNLIVLIFFFTICISSIYAQEKDFELWSGIQLKKDINKKIRVIFEEEFRFNENVTKIKKYYSDVGVLYKFNKHIRFGVYYRFVKKNNPDSYYSNRHVFYSNLYLRTKISRFAISFRARYQVKYIDVYSSEQGFIPRNYNRNKLSLKYNIKNNPISPFISCELYYQLNRPEGNEFSKVRYTAGFEYEMNKKNSFEIYYRIQQQLNINNPVKSNVLGVAYCYSL